MELLHRYTRMCEIDIGNLKTRNLTKLVQVRNFITFELKVIRHEERERERERGERERERERERESFYTDCFYIVSSQPNQRAAPVAHKVVWPRPALKVNLLLSRQELN